MTRTHSIIVTLLAIIVGGAIGYSVSDKCSYAPGELCNQQNTPGNATSTGDSFGLQQYAHANYGFSFDHPKLLQFNIPQIYFLETPLVGLVTPRDLYPNTNFSEGLITVSATLNSTDAACFVNPETKKTLTNRETINGVVWYKDVIGGVGAGNIYNSRLYRAMNDGACYELVETVHTGQIGNYPDGTQQIDEEDVFDILHAAVISFDFVQQ